MVPPLEASPYRLDPLSMELASKDVFALSRGLTLNVKPDERIAACDNPDSHPATSMIERRLWGPDTLPEEFFAQLLKILAAIAEVTSTSEDAL